MYPRRLITGGTSKTATEQALAAAARSDVRPACKEEYLEQQQQQQQLLLLEISIDARGSR